MPRGRGTDMRKICLRCGSKFGSRAEYCPHDGSLLATDDEIADPLLGTVLLEQFRVEKQIGVGGMGTVYRAHQTTFGRDVAIKVLSARSWRATSRRSRGSNGRRGSPPRSITRTWFGYSCRGAFRTSDSTS
jgi:serine/threonine protein kinase